MFRDILLDLVRLALRGRVAAELLHPPQNPDVASQDVLHPHAGAHFGALEGLLSDVLQRLYWLQVKLGRYPQDVS